MNRSTVKESHWTCGADFSQIQPESVGCCQRTAGFSAAELKWFHTYFSTSGNCTHLDNYIIIAPHTFKLLLHSVELLHKYTAAEVLFPIAYTQVCIFVLHVILCTFSTFGCSCGQQRKNLIVQERVFLISTVFMTINAWILNHIWPALEAFRHRRRPWGLLMNQRFKCLATATVDMFSYEARWWKCYSLGLGHLTGSAAAVSYAGRTLHMQVKAESEVDLITRQRSTMEGLRWMKLRVVKWPNRSPLKCYV